MAGQKLKSFYHYTTEEACDAIEESGVIRQSRLHQPDAAFGEGVYGTSLPPLAGKKMIAQNNWGDLWQQNEKRGKLERAIHILIPKKKLTKAKSERHIYIYSGDLVLKKYKYEIIDLDDDDSMEQFGEDSSDESDDDW